MINITRSYGNRKRIIISAVVLAFVSVILFTVAFCVHDHVDKSGAVRRLPDNGRNYIIKDKINYDKSYGDFITVVDSGDYEKYDNIYKYDCFTENGDGILNIGFDTLVYSYNGERYIFRQDESLPEKSVRCEFFVCNQLSSLSYNDFLCEMITEDRSLANNCIRGKVCFQENNTMRWTDEVTQIRDDGSISTIKTGLYFVDPTYSTVQFGHAPLGNKQYISTTRPSGWGLSDGFMDNPYYAAIIIYCSPDIEVVYSESESWDYDALGI